MILIVTNQTDYTADFLILELRKRGVDFIRFNTEDYPTKVEIYVELNDFCLDGYFSFGNRELHFSDISSVWFRRPVPPQPSKEILDPSDYDFIVTEGQNALEGIWKILDCFWISKPDNIRKAENKIFQLSIARETGFKISPTVITNSPSKAKYFYSKKPQKTVYKPMQQGRIIREEGVSLIYSNLIPPEFIQDFDGIKFTPALLQKYVEKNIEIRVTVIGDKVFAVAIHSQNSEISKHDWRRGNTALLHHEIHELPYDISRKCELLVKRLELNFGAIDLILTPNNEYYFLEINPNGQWAWIQQLIPSIPLRESLVDLLVSGG